MIPNGTSPHQGVGVRVRGLRKALGGRAVLQDIDLDVHPGETFVIMGPSGSGKTVLLKHIIGLESPDAGEILLDGQPLHAPGLMDRFRLAMVFQSSALLSSITVAENVGLYLAEHRLHSPAEITRIVREKLALVGLADSEDKYPGELSGGMRKRAAIARALVMNPHLILYDEPTSELDPLIALAIADEIRRLQLRLGVTSIVVTHDRDLAFGIADRIAMIHEGRILAVGGPGQIRQSAVPLVQRFLQAEFKEPNLATETTSP
ncbi:MAG TPA: ATP-binding cassette domain-containing protein [Candidatus Paceibacterota bacterium]|nr:ATP-binding cassette domain-containing protein [Verrucomicrobiota bacterium]HOX01778.1 ATP-binding cassette domain-containing protein [Verrucomicrobiota bacterium]HRZ44571.1 ATP-binding cassette domain-containing protein [Candidatus Paceibacterota bacterium]HRZ93648.1 ATP-binding cassette domain-containing protein [Candidatus Paceibacterota bacterium]